MIIIIDYSAKGDDIVTVVVVGGNERMKKDYISLAKEKGYKAKVFLNMSSKVKKCLGDPDAIVIFTSVVSHKMVISVEEQAKKRNIPIIRHKNNSKVAFAECLEMVEKCSGNCSGCKLNKDINKFYKSV